MSAASISLLLSSISIFLFHYSMDTQPEPNFYGPPLIDSEGFSSLHSPAPMFEFRANPAPEGEDKNMGAAAPQPLACLLENPVPPFLSKTYDLVNDRTLDPIISWGSAGQSFVVWDPLEFSRIVLPMNFKHNNFSSFVRQLNTYMGGLERGEMQLLQGFRKIDSDKWEFANEAFRRGEKQQLKNIQRRRTQQTVSHTGHCPKLELESEIDTLRKERGEMMQEVVQLQQQQLRSVHHIEAVNERIEAAEKRQKQMVSFLAKLIQKPAFIARLKLTKEHRDIGVKRKLQIENLQSHESEAAQGFMNTASQLGEGMPNLVRGKSVMSPLEEVGPKYFVSSPEDLVVDKDFPEFSSPGFERQQDIWSMEMERQTSMLNCSPGMWGNVGNYEVPELVASGGLSDIWDLDSLQAEPSGVNEPEIHNGWTNNKK